MPPGTTKLRVAKVTIKAPVTSFRYPHFLVGRQVTFDMPPPSTVYGHVASALGELPEPRYFRFAYDFRFVSKCSDLEHQHIITAEGKSFKIGAESYPISVQATVQPHLRDFLFKPTLTLYLDRQELALAFRSPAFCVILGRSQDLAEIASVEEIDLEEREGAYFEHTLLPFSYRHLVAFGVTVAMPKYIEPPPERRAYFDRYIMLHDKVFGGQIERPESVGTRRMLWQGERFACWVDPTSPQDHGVNRGIVFHSFET